MRSMFRALSEVGGRLILLIVELLLDIIFKRK
jgi:hypothetical protein